MDAAIAPYVAEGNTSVSYLHVGPTRSPVTGSAVPGKGAGYERSEPHLDLEARGLAGTQRLIVRSMERFGEAVR